MEGKKLAVAVVLIIVVVLAVVFAAKRVSNKPPPPNWVLDQTVQKIDYKTQELVTESLRDWTGKHAPDETGRYKNPKTGTYTMVDTMKCGACGGTIPVPQYYEALHPKGATPAPAPKANAKDLPPPMPMGIDPAVIQKIRAEYKCPKCGKSPFAF